MRQGFSPVITFDKRGEIFSIATGSDACAEHEVGSARLQGALCQQTIPDGSIIEDLKRGLDVVYPNLLERKSIAFGEKLSFVIDGDEAAIGFCSNPTMLLTHRELRFMTGESVAGAWDDHHFALKVKGDKLVKKLTAFAVAVHAGDGVFAGSFLDNRFVGGVCIALKSKLRPEHKVLINKAQAKYEADLRLKAASNLDEFHEWCRQNHQDSIGYLWPVWRGNVVDGEVVYALNPGYGIDAQYWGPYTLESIKEWLLGGRKGSLRPVS